MSKFWKREDPLERDLRSAFTPSEEFEQKLGDRVRQSTPRVRYARATRGSFATALAVFMLGTFASFGGVSMAASGAKQTVSAVAHLTVSQKPVVHRTTAASDEYGNVKPAQITKVKPKVKASNGVSPAVTTTKTQGSLPFTGISLAATGLLSLLFLGLGLALRRMGSRSL